MLQQDQPGDYVIATGETHSVRDFLESAFSYAGVHIEGHVGIDQKYFRPAEVDSLVGDARKANRVLGWRHKVTFQELTRIMVDADMAKVSLQIPGGKFARSIPGREEVGPVGGRSN